MVLAWENICVSTCRQQLADFLGLTRQKIQRHPFETDLFSDQIARAVFVIVHAVTDFEEDGEPRRLGLLIIEERASMKERAFLHGLHLLETAAWETCLSLV